MHPGGLRTSRAAAHPTQCGGSSRSHKRPGASPLALALTAHTRRQSGVKPSSSAARYAQPSPAPLATPALPELGLSYGPPARYGQENATQPLDHQQVTHRLMKSHSPLQKEPNQGKTKTKTGETRERLWF